MKRYVSAIKKSAVANFLRYYYRRAFPRPEDFGVSLDEPLRFVADSRGVVHVGANTGQEAWVYAAFRKPVIWFEANPDLMARLEENIKRFRNQIAVNAVLLESDDEPVDFYVTNNDSLSSSTLPLGGHAEMYPGIEVQSRKKLRSATLKSKLAQLDPRKRFDAMILDVQGAELSVLKGAGAALKQFRWIYCECADFEIYVGGCTCESLGGWMREHGFIEHRRYQKNHTAGLGSTFDILYHRQ